MGKRNPVHQMLMTLLALAVLFSMSSTALAALGAPDLDTKGAISVTMRDSATKNTVPGGTLTIYRVAQIHIDNADLSYVYTDSFAASGLTLGDLRDSGLAGGLAAYAKDKSLAGTTKTIGSNGVARFEGLSLGLYLVVQNTAAGGYYTISPFLVSVPLANSGRTAWIYDVDASPKVQLAQKSPTPSPTPTPTATPSATPTPTPSSSGGSGKLPQSGQLNWPVPVLAISGLALFALGWVITFLQREKPMKNKAGILFMILGAVLVGAALSLLLYNQNEDGQAGAAMEDILPQMQEVIPERTAAQHDPLAPPDSLAQPEDTEMAVMEIDGYGYIGYLSIPALHLELPVMAQWDYDRLKIAPCRYYGSTKSDDLVIVAHNYKRHLGNIYKLRPGDSVYFTDMEGVVSIYAVAETETLEPTAVEEMTGGGWDLTLFTCTYGGKSRVTVRCRAETAAS